MSNIWLTFRIIDTVDGSEILQTSTVEVASLSHCLSHCLPGFDTSQVVSRISEPSTVWPTQSFSMGLVLHVYIYFPPTLKKNLKTTQSTGK